MTDDVTRALEAIRDSERARVYVLATGAGAGLQRTLWDVPGISRILVGAAFPYAAEDTAKWLGFTPASFCSEETAIDLATAAFMRAASMDGARAVGIGLTASVASLSAHRSDHRVFAAYVTDDGAGLARMTLAKDAGVIARKRDGETCDALGLAALLAAFGRGDSVAFEPCDDAVRARLFERPFFRANGRRAHVSGLPENAVLFPGAFNPPHFGHFGAATSVSSASGRPVVFSTTVDPPHKPALGTAEVLRRAKMLEGYDALFTEGDPLYLEKARRFPGRAFLAGADAFVRMLDPRWGPDVPSLVRELSGLGAHFFVAPRAIEGKLVSLDDIRAMPEYAEAIAGLSTSSVEGAWDVSSSELRAATARDVSEPL